MKALTALLLAALFITACTMREPLTYSGELEIGEIVEGELETETPDTFRLNLDADTYILGVVDQISVDVVVTLYDSTGNNLGRFDGPGEGPEIFQFEIDDAGEYLLEVAPFEDDSGSYTIELKVVEPIAEDPEKRADQLFTPYAGNDVPGGVIGVMRDGKLIFSKAYGMANLSHNIAFTVNTPSNIGSVSKQFTAFSILLLEQQGKLSLDDDVRKHIPELPDLGEVITINNLLNHTNGLREVYNLMPMTGWKGEDQLRREEIIQMLMRQKELQASPGEEYNYNNSAFIMLAEIVKRKTDTGFPEWMKQNVFDPLGMYSTVVRTDPRTIIPNASQGYAITNTGIKEAGDLDASFGAGGIYTTMGDFNSWLKNFHDASVGGEDLITRLVTPDTLNNGDTMTYALGIGVGEFRGLKMYSHGGADIAHRAMLVYFPEINAGVASLSNHAGFPAGRIAFAVAEAFFGDEMEEEDEESKGEVDSTEVVVPEKLLKAYAGKYKLANLGVVLEYNLKEGVLISSVEGQPDIVMIPESDSVFGYKGVEASVKFNLNNDGKAINAVHSQGGTDYELIPFAPYEPTIDELKALEGRFFCEELETYYTLELQDSTMMLHIKNTKEIKLSPIEENTFKGDVFFISELVILKDDGGEVKAFTVSNGRTRGIYFEKK
ncbi:MAG: beta-lactamase family protein [Bacteroidales bacterium]|nr:beta-lactamase family protein [Bacteroidales bacterium]